MLFNLQVLRGLAALGVVFYHADLRLAGDWQTDFSGVAIFFVISGFIMCFITRETADNFLKMRLIRIVPMYWLCTLAVAFLMVRLAIFSPSTWTQTAPVTASTEPLWIYIGRSLLFIPSSNQPALGVGWTLNYEIYFYVLFAVALWISRRAAPLIVGVTIVTVCRFYSLDYVEYFAAGIAIFYLWRSGAEVARGWPVILACLLGLICFFSAQFVRPLWPEWLAACRWWFPPAVVACVLFLESNGVVVSWKPLVLLGDASYSLYLTHTIFFEVARHYLRVWGLPPPRDSLFVMLSEVVAATVIGVLVFSYVEKPILGRVRRALNGRQRRADELCQHPLGRLTS